MCAIALTRIHSDRNHDFEKREKLIQNRREHINYKDMHNIRSIFSLCIIFDGRKRRRSVIFYDC